MTTQEAKLILQAYRPGGEDDADPFFVAALELAQTESDLGAWLERQRTFDMDMRKALQSEIPPAWLKDSILEKKSVPHHPSASRPLLILNLLVGLTAAIILFVGIAVFQQTPRSGRVDKGMTVARFTRQALDIKEQGRIALAAKNTDPTQLRKWLEERGAPHDFVLPPGLQGVASIGCQSFDLGGTKVSLICFDLGNNQVAHLFVVEKSALADASPSSLPQLHDDNGFAFATWSAGSKSYVLTGDHVSKEMLQKLI